MLTDAGKLSGTNADRDARSTTDCRHRSNWHNRRQRKAFVIPRNVISQNCCPSLASSHKCSADRGQGLKKVQARLTAPEGPTAFEPSLPVRAQANQPCLLWSVRLEKAVHVSCCRWFCSLHEWHAQLAGPLHYCTRLIAVCTHQ